MSNNQDRLAAIEELPEPLRDDALVPWKLVAQLLAAEDVEHCRQNLLAAGLPVVEVSARRRLPRWGVLRQFLREREK
jgi:hypothetical protein